MMAPFPFKPNPDNFPTTESGQKKYLWSLLRYTFWLVFGFVFVFGVSFVFLLKENPSYEMIDLRERNILEAVKWLQQRSLKPMISEKIDPSVPRYHVIDQNPAPGATIKENRTVSLIVSFGHNNLVMPNYHGSNYNQAYQYLLSYFSGYKKTPRITKVEKYSDLAEGLVVDHYPRYQQPINFEEPIIFVVSRGIATSEIQITNYLYSDYIQTEEKLLSLGIRVNALYVASSEKELAGKIVFQSLPENTLLKSGEAISFTVGFYDPQVVKSLESGTAKNLEVIRVYHLQVPLQSNLDKFIKTLNNGQEIFFPSTNQGYLLKKRRSILIEITDQTGKRILLDDYLNSGDKINFPYRSVGKGNLQIFIDGKNFDSVDF